MDWHIWVEIDLIVRCFFLLFSLFFLPALMLFYSVALHSCLFSIYFVVCLHCILTPSRLRKRVLVEHVLRNRHMTEDQDQPSRGP